MKAFKTTQHSTEVTLEPCKEEEKDKEEEKRNRRRVGELGAKLLPYRCEALSLIPRTPT